MDYDGIRVMAPIIAYGGMVHARYMRSMMELSVACAARSLDVHWPVIQAESLIGRARNAAAAAARAEGSDYLMFIDCDVVFEVEDFFRLLDADRDVCAGLYPKKYLNERKLGELVRRRSSLPPNWRALVSDCTTQLRAERSNGEAEAGDDPRLVEVREAATGFMLIKRAVFDEIARQRPDSRYRNDVSYYRGWGDEFHDFFPCGANPQAGRYESEDYGFCRLWRECGGSVYAATDVQLRHWGSFEYAGDDPAQRVEFGIDERER